MGRSLLAATESHLDPSAAPLVVAAANANAEVSASGDGAPGDASDADTAAQATVLPWTVPTPALVAPHASQIAAPLPEASAEAAKLPANLDGPLPVGFNGAVRPVDTSQGLASTSAGITVSAVKPALKAGSSAISDGGLEQRQVTLESDSPALLAVLPQEGAAAIRAGQAVDLNISNIDGRETKGTCSTPAHRASSDAPGNMSSFSDVLGEELAQFKVKIMAAHASDVSLLGCPGCITESLQRSQLEASRLKDENYSLRSSLLLLGSDLQNSQTVTLSSRQDDQRNGSADTKRSTWMGSGRLLAPGVVRHKPSSRKASSGLGERSLGMQGAGGVEGSSDAGSLSPLGRLRRGKFRTTGQSISESYGSFLAVAPTEAPPVPVLQAVSSVIVTAPTDDVARPSAICENQESCANQISREEAESQSTGAGSPTRRPKSCRFETVSDGSEEWDGRDPIEDDELRSEHGKGKQKQSRMQSSGDAELARTVSSEVPCFTDTPAATQDDERSGAFTLVAKRRLSIAKTKCDFDGIPSLVSNGEKTNNRLAVGGKRTTGKTATMPAMSSISGVISSFANWRPSYRQVNPEGQDADAVNNDEARLSPSGSFVTVTSSTSRSYFHFEVLACWEACEDKQGQVKQVKRLKTAKSRENDTFVDAPSADPSESRRECRCMMRPDNMFRFSWDILCAICIVFDVIYTPLTFLEPNSNGFTTCMSWVIRLIWTADVPLSTSTGFFAPDGEVEMRRRKVLRRYCTTWFPIDLGIVLTDWLEAFLKVSTFSNNAARVSKAVRVMRMIRMVRLLRLARLPGIAERILDRMGSQSLLKAGGGVLKILGLILILTHIMGCMWYWIGNSSDEDMDNWVRHNRLQDSEFEYIYMTSFHWSLTQFAGTMEVNPRNIRERIFAVFALLFSFIGSAAFVSSITSSLTRYHIESSQEVYMFRELRRYLERHRISPKLVWRINRNATHALIESKRDIKEADVGLLNLISEGLRMDLHFEIYSPVLCTHPLFKKIFEICPKAMGKLCHEAVTVETLGQDDIVFVEEEPTPVDKVMFFVASGSLNYISEDDIGMSEEVFPRMWVCEPVLWVDWNTYLGTMRAKTSCKVIILNAKVFQQQVAMLNRDNFQVKAYAHGVCKALCETPCEVLSDVGRPDQADFIMETACLTTKTHPHRHSRILDGPILLA